MADNIYFIAIVCAFSGYLIAFISTIRNIIGNFQQAKLNENSLYWSIAIGVTYSTAFYCIIYYLGLALITNNYFSEPTFKFFAGINDKLFGFLLGAIIAQFLSALFSRRQYEYQKARDLAQANADKFETLIKDFERAFCSRYLVMTDLIQEFEKLINCKAKHLQDDYRKIEKETEAIRDGKIVYFNESKNTWRVEMAAINAGLAVLNCQTCVNFIDTNITQKLTEAHNNVIYDKQALQNARQILAAIQPDRNAILQTLMNLAKEARKGQYKCPTSAEIASLAASNPTGANTP